MKWCVVFCLFVVVEIGLVDSLKATQKGVCVSKHTVTKTRPKTILVPTGKWCGTKKCTVKQTRKQKYTVVTNQLMCCKGFVYTSDTDSCAPVCSTGCANGTCADPDVCQCADPLYLDPTTRNKCLTPTCDHPCINGVCFLNNTCACDENYSPFNATHCAMNCQEGFELDSSLKCVLKCKSPLYLDITKNKCITPACDHACINGICSANNTCKCKEDYMPYNATHCAMNCEGELDSCLNCVPKCNEGYKMSVDKCEPECVPACVNGRCVAPNVCECGDGLVKKNRYVCLEKQHGCGACRSNGTCLVTITEPETVTRTYETQVPCRTGICTVRKTKLETQMVVKLSEEICCPSYEPDDEMTKCVPICENGCENGQCVAPDICQCTPPLVFHNETVPYFCGPPVCDQPCNNSTCTANNKCTCNKGFIPKDDYNCVPHCTNCNNGDCISPGICNCHKGYTQKDGHCIPKCKGDCSNGYCSAPETCICIDGYKRQDGKCQPVCKKPCLNGDCIAPNTCQCKEGFEAKNGHNEICIPKCNDGYELRDDLCQPVCEKPCVHGECAAPNTCNCFAGYERRGNETCVPQCKDECINGFCAKPDTCGCNSGYALRNNKCEPVCKTPCTNGYCQKPNTCACSEGYNKDKSTDKCTPKCDSCTNGVCIAPKKCECNKGYTQTDKGCAPKCDRACVNGECTAPNECRCNSGYMKDSSNSSVCFKPCGVCDHGMCKDGVCVCKPDMEFINGTCIVSIPTSPEMSSADTTGLASVQMTWLVGGAVLLLLIVLVLVVISRLYARKLPQKAPDDGTFVESVMYTRPNTLLHKDDLIEEEDTNETLLEKGKNELDNAV